jgi:hypothetical protein
MDGLYVARAAIFQGLRFAIEHRFATSVERIESLLHHPDLYARMQRVLPGIERIELLDQEERDRVVRRRVRYTPRAEDKLPSFARGIINPEMLIWVEESTIYRDQHRIEYRVLPNLPAKWTDRFSSHGTFRFVAGERGVTRHIDGEIVVRAPLVGRIVERMLVKEVTLSFTAEAAEIATWLLEPQ